MNIQEHTERLSRYKEARDSAVDWILNLQREDGVIGPIEEGGYFYRLPWTLAHVGKTEAAYKFLWWFRKKYPSFSNKQTAVALLGNYATQYTYLISNLICGTHLMMQFDLSSSLLGLLARYKDPMSGGYVNCNNTLGPSDRIDAWISAQAGLAFIYTGRIEEAIQVGNFLENIYIQQPDISTELFFAYRRTTQSLFSHSEQGKASSVSIHNQKARQWFFAPGLIAAFLVKLYQATNQIVYLELAENYQNFVQNCSEQQFNGIEVCKTGWSASLLYQETGKPEYFNWAIRVGDYFVDSQANDGRWKDDRYNPSTTGQDIALTAQDILWLDASIAALSTKEY